MQPCLAMFAKVHSVVVRLWVNKTEGNQSAKPRSQDPHEAVPPLLFGEVEVFSYAVTKHHLQLQPYCHCWQKIPLSEAYGSIFWEPIPGENMPFLRLPHGPPWLRNLYPSAVFYPIQNGIRASRRVVLGSRDDTVLGPAAEYRQGRGVPYAETRRSLARWYRRLAMTVLRRFKT